MAGPSAAIVEQALTAPPFVPSGGAKPGFWVARLHQLVEPAVQQSIGAAVASALQSSDAGVVAGAFGFFWLLPRAFGAEQVARTAQVRASFLATTTDPSEPTEKHRDAHDRVVDQDCLSFLEAMLLRGENPSEIVFAVGSADRPWFLRHAVELVRSGTTDAGSVVVILKHAPASELVAALAPIAALGTAQSDEVRQAVERARLTPNATPAHFARGGGGGRGRPCRGRRGVAGWNGRC